MSRNSPSQRLESHLQHEQSIASQTGLRAPRLVPAQQQPQKRTLVAPAAPLPPKPAAQDRWQLPAAPGSTTQKSLKSPASSSSLSSSEPHAISAPLDSTIHAIQADLDSMSAEAEERRRNLAQMRSQRPSIINFEDGDSTPSSRSRTRGSSKSSIVSPLRSGAMPNQQAPPMPVPSQSFSAPHWRQASALASRQIPKVESYISVSQSDALTEAGTPVDASSGKDHFRQSKASSLGSIPDFPIASNATSSTATAAPSPRQMPSMSRVRSGRSGMNTAIGAANGESRSGNTLTVAHPGSVRRTSSFYSSGSYVAPIAEEGSSQAAANASKPAGNVGTTAGGLLTPNFILDEETASVSDYDITSPNPETTAFTDSIDSGAPSSIPHTRTASLIRQAKPAVVQMKQNIPNKPSNPDLLGSALSVPQESHKPLLRAMSPAPLRTKSPSQMASSMASKSLPGIGVAVTTEEVELQDRSPPQKMLLNNDDSNGSHRREDSLTAYDTAIRNIRSNLQKGGMVSNAPVHDIDNTLANRGQGGDRSSLASLTDLMRRAAGVLHNLDRGRTASKIGLLDMYNSGEGKERMRNRGESLERERAEQMTNGRVSPITGRNSIDAAPVSPIDAAEDGDGDYTTLLANALGKSAGAKLDGKWPTSYKGAGAASHEPYVPPFSKRIGMDTVLTPKKAKKEKKSKDSRGVYTDGSPLSSLGMEKQNRSYSDDDGHARRKRTCFGVPLKIIIPFAVVLFLILAVAIIVPIIILVVKPGHNSSSSTPTNTTASVCPASACGNSGFPYNLQANASLSPNCGCICSNGYSGLNCTASADGACTLLGTSLANSLGVQNSNATVGLDVSKILAQLSTFPALTPASEPAFNASIILAAFSSQQLSCIAQNTLVFLSGVNINSISSRNLHALLRRRPVPEPDNVLTSASIIYDGPPLTASASGTPSPTGTSSAPTSTSTSARPNSRDVTLAQLALLYTFQMNGFNVGQVNSLAGYIESTLDTAGFNGGVQQYSNIGVTIDFNAQSVVYT